MAILTNAEYSGLYLTTSGIFNNNTSQDITPADLRAGFQDTWDSWVASDATLSGRIDTINAGSGIPTGYFQSAYFGDVDAGNYSKFEEDSGFKVSYGSGIAWDDMRVPGLSTLRTGTSSPDLENFVGSGLLANTFDGASTLEQVYFAVQMAHGYKSNSTLHPHVHWAPTTNDSGNICWFLQYTWQDINGVFAGPTTISGVQAATGVAWTHQLCELPEISGAGASVSSMIVARLYRAPTFSLDTYEADAAFLEFDLHYQKDTDGSRSEFSK
jgi:hypothetical protein